MKTKEGLSLLGIAFFFFFEGALECSPNPAASRSQEIASHARQAQQFLKEQRPDLAIAEFRALVALDPNNVDARGNLGVLLFFQGDYPAAIPQLRAALRIRPTLWRMQAHLGTPERRTDSSKSPPSAREKPSTRLQAQKIQIEAGRALSEMHRGAG